MKVNRRDILKASAVFLGYSIVGGVSVAVMNGCKADDSPDWEPQFFTNDEIATLAEVAERIIPKTDTPGAKDALVHRYMDEAVIYNYTDEEKEMMKAGVKGFDAEAKSQFSKRFVDLSADEMDTVLQKLADDAKAAKKSGNTDVQLFPHVKGMVAAGYFTSEVGATQALVYEPVPGPYQGCIPLSEVGGTYAL